MVMTAKQMVWTAQADQVGTQFYHEPDGVRSMDRNLLEAVKKNL